MIGFQLTFFTCQNRTHKGHPLAEWLISAAKDIGLGGATLVRGAVGFGRERKLHSANFLYLAEQPLEITMAVTGEDADRLLALLKEEGLDIFYIKTPIEYGMTEDI